MVTEDSVFELHEMYETIFCEVIKTMMDKVLLDLSSQYQSSWYYALREDCYEVDNGQGDGQGLMVLVLKPIELG
jgi:hypothetical protein